MSKLCVPFKAKVIIKDRGIDLLHLADENVNYCFIHRSSKNVSNSSESADNLLSSLRSITLRVASIVMERGADLFCTLRNELTAEDLRRNATVLQSSPAINILIPYTLANLDGVDDSKVRMFFLSLRK